MTTQVKTFFARIVDEYGGEYQQALVAVRAFSENSQNTGYSQDCTGPYKIESVLEAITYNVNYWYTEQTKANGKRSRPLYNDQDGVFSDVFSVDLEDPKIVDILNSEMEHTEKVLHAIRSDISRKFD